MFNLSLEGAKKTREALMGLFGKIKQAAEFSLWQAAKNIRDEMREAGKPVIYPIKWDTTKQRKAFFASNGFGQGIPSKRRGQTNGAWRAIQIQDGSQVWNPLSHSVFVNGRPTAPAGRRQSRIHQGRWKIFHVVVDAVIKKLPDALRKRILTTIKEQGFTVQ